MMDVLLNDEIKASVPENCNDPLEFLPACEKKNEESKREEGGFISFSSRFDNPLMWAHYADAHKGICLQFDFPVDSNGRLSGEMKASFEEDTNSRGNNKRYAFIKIPNDKISQRQYLSIRGTGKAYYAPLIEVNYELVRPKREACVQMSLCSGEEIDSFNLSKVFYTKSKDWSYEKEWRLMVSLGGCAGFHDDAFFVKGLTCFITGIILGAKYMQSRRTTGAKIIQCFRKTFGEKGSIQWQLPVLSRAKFSDCCYKIELGPYEMPTC